MTTGARRDTLAPFDGTRYRHLSYSTMNDNEIPASAQAEAVSGSYHHRIRAAEVDLVKHWLPPGSNVLEVGGGDGFQARLLADGGCRVSSIDVPSRSLRGPLWHPVEDYDGRKFPFEDQSF